MKEKITFRPLARLLLQLGDQLIRNESIALLELVKNAYDADATRVNIKMKKIDEPEKGLIIIEDNGTGMDVDIIKNVWMEPGSDYKDKLFREKSVKSKFNRQPLGEKGIGRFSVHKLGNEIQLITRKDKKQEVVINIDWNTFKKSRYLEEVPIEIILRDNPEVFTGSKTGTKIIIQQLKSLWTRGMVRDIYRSINSLCSPFDAPDSFKLNFEIDKKEWIESLLSIKDLTNYALYRFDCELEGQYIEKFTYQFMPWQTMKKMEPKKITEKDTVINKVSKMMSQSQS